MQIELLAPDLMVASRLQAVLPQARSEWASVPGRLLLVDAGPGAAPGWAESIRAAKADGALVIAFAPHSMADRLKSARAAGADLVAVNGDMLTDPLAVIRRLRRGTEPAASS